MMNRFGFGKYLAAVSKLAVWGRVFIKYKTGDNVNPKFKRFWK